jgi:hypothetical protein
MLQIAAHHDRPRSTRHAALASAARARRAARNHVANVTGPRPATTAGTPVARPSLQMAPPNQDTLSIDQLLGARAAAELVLDDLGLRNYRFDVEPREDRFEVLVEHERDGAWHDVRFTEDAAVLLAARTDASTRRAVASRWRERLAAHAVARSSSGAT